MRIKVFLIVLSTSVLGACTQSSVMPLAADTILIKTSADPLCGSARTQSVAARRAAIETITRGYDAFVILANAAQNNSHVVGYTPVATNTVTTGMVTSDGSSAFAQGISTTTQTGGQAIISGTLDQGLIVKMFRAGDPLGANAIPARNYLGAGWKNEISQSSVGTCFD